MARIVRLGAAGVLAASVVVALPVAAASHIEDVLVDVASPRGVAVDDDGTLFVASSGTGGDGACTENAAGAEVCYGESGAILHVPDVSEATLPTTADTLIPDLPSLADENGAEASGPADVYVEGGTLYYTIGLGADPAVRSDDLSGEPRADQLATLQSAVASDGTGTTQVADLGQHEADDPDGQGPDSNPFGVVATIDTAFVLDSGGNTLVTVDLSNGGTTGTHTVFPPVPVPSPGLPDAPHGSDLLSDAVPTQLAMRGTLLDVGHLTGFPFHPGAASVWQVQEDTEPSMLHTGFTHVMDVAWHDGDLYVLELAQDGLLAEGPPLGALVRVRVENGTVTRELLFDDQPMPGGMAFDPTDEGMLYVSVGSAGPDGKVIRVDTNTAPSLLTVIDDTAATEEDQRLVADDDADDDAHQAVVADVAANDTDVTSVSVIDNSRGAVYQGSIVYQPPAHVVGEDRVTYRGCDDDGHCLIGVLGVTITETQTDRIAGATRIQTAIEASQGRYPNGATVVVIARADLYPDALAGGPLATVAGGPILLTSPDGLDPDVADELERLGAATAYLLGGPVALSSDVEVAIGGLVDETVRLEGGDRFATAVAIRDELETVLDVPLDHAYVVEGADPDPSRGWPDAVAVSALASWNGQPILLAETNRLPGVTADALAGIDATIIGGAVAIDAAAMAQIESAADEVDRIGGATRYETSRLVAERSFDEGLQNVLLTLVSGGNWPDALVAGPLVAASTGGFLLVHPSDLTESPEALEFIDDHGPFLDIDLFGGTAAVSAEVEAGIAAANAD